MVQATDILFDLDGTIFNTIDGIFSCIEKAVADLGGGKVPDRAEPWTFIGPPLIATFARLVGAARADEALRLYKKYYMDDQGILLSTLYDGMPEALTTLKARGKKLYVTTSKAESSARLLLDHYDVMKNFTGVYGSRPDGSRSAKAEVVGAALDAHKIDRNAAVLIGDHRFDMLGAKANAIRAIGVTWGFGRVQDLVENGAVAIVDNPSELLGLIA